MSEQTGLEGHEGTSSGTAATHFDGSQRRFVTSSRRNRLPLATWQDFSELLAAATRRCLLGLSASGRMWGRGSYGFEQSTCLCC